MPTSSTKPGPVKSAVGLELPRTLSETQWTELGRELGEDARASAFRVGDWLLHAEKLDGRIDDERYVTAEELTGLERTTLYNYASVCRSIEISRRREDLTFGHHQAVTGLEPADQDRLLKEAAKGGWSILRMREAVQSVGARDIVLKEVPSAVANAWELAAKEAEQPLWQWLHDQIENAAQQLEQASQLRAA